MGYPSFLSKWIQEDHNAASLGLRSWFDRILPSLEALNTADDIRGRRIVGFQNSLVDLIEALSSKREVAQSSPLRLELNAVQSPRNMDQDFGPANSPTGPLEREPQTYSVPDDTSSESHTTSTSAASSAIKPLRSNKNARKRSKSRSDGEEEHRIQTGREKRRALSTLKMTPSQKSVSILPK
ncbi:hypothetical protein VKT23_010743 [Stygiomarasmius scandens]|uniref:Uncharacterized protein n=1 Tax=Marasmiellus scandens TaxID=2682957 RepID=A0ABR1JDW2_9AGAR